jgi:hypothetical protein
MRTVALLLTLVTVALAARAADIPLVNPPARIGDVPVVSVPAALNHIGERSAVCGQVMTTRIDTADQSMVIAIDAPYPAQQFSFLILAVDRTKFGTPELTLLQKRICGTGVIQLAQGRAQMLLREPGQLTVP